MFTLGFGGIPSGEYNEADLQEALAERMRALLESHGWFSGFGRDPILILIEFEELCENGEPEDE